MQSEHKEHRMKNHNDKETGHQGHHGGPASPAGGHASHHAHMVADFRKRFWISLIATVPVLMLSPLIQSFFGYSVDFTGSMFVLFGISSFVYFYGGWPFLQGLFKETKKKQLGMMTLIALAISVAYFYSSAVVFGVKGKVFFWELVTLIDIMLLGHLLFLLELVFLPFKIFTHKSCKKPVKIPLISHCKLCHVGRYAWGMAFYV